MGSDGTPHDGPGVRTSAERLSEIRGELLALLNAREEPAPITVLILTFCRKADLFYGTSLIFNTLRAGFPTARIIVVDNASLPELRGTIASFAHRTGCEHFQIEDPCIDHPEFLDTALGAFAKSEHGENALVFLDPDVCLWENCEGFEFDGLMAGRLYRAFRPEITQTLAMPRLHTSFLWIPNARRLREAIAECQRYHYDFRPFDTWSTRLGGRWCRYDTGASLYAVLGNRMNAFTEEHLNCFDHIFSGCHIDWLEKALDQPTLDLFQTIHERAREGDLAALRGVGQLQDSLWQNPRW